MTEENKNLESKIRGLSSEKGQYVSQSALDAKEEYDAHLDSLDEVASGDDIQIRRSEFELFNDNIKILLSVFYKSRFDEFLSLLANPQRLFVVNFFYWSL